jgi:hypothetical protein
VTRRSDERKWRADVKEVKGGSKDVPKSSSVLTFAADVIDARGHASNYHITDLAGPVTNRLPGLLGHNGRTNYIIQQTVNAT